MGNNGHVELRDAIKRRIPRLARYLGELARAEWYAAGPFTGTRRFTPGTIDCSGVEVGLPDGRDEERENQGDPPKAYEVLMLVARAEDELIGKIQRTQEERGAHSEKQPHYKVNPRPRHYEIYRPSSL